MPSSGAANMCGWMTRLVRPDERRATFTESRRLSYYAENPSGRGLGPSQRPHCGSTQRAIAQLMKLSILSSVS